MRRVPFLALLMFVLVLASALPAGAQQIELTVTICCGQLDRHEWIESVAAAYMEQNPHVTVHTVLNASIDAVLTRIAGGVGPDLIWTGQAWGDTIDLFTPMTQFQNENPEFFSDLVPGMVDGFSFNGITYAIPFSASTRAMAINQELLAQAGFPLPGPDWTWDDALDIARKVTRDVDNDGVPDVLGVGVDWQPWNHFAYGGSIYSEDGRRANLNKEVVRETVQIWNDLWSGAIPVMPSGYAGIPGSTRELFTFGQLAMIDIGIFDIANFRANADFAWDVQELPLYYKDGQYHKGGAWSGEGYALYNGSKHPEEAFRFAKFMLSNESVSRLAEVGAIMPAQIRALHSAFIDPSIPPANMMAFVHAMDYQMAAWAHPAFGQVMQNMFHPIWNTDFAHNGSRSVESLLEESQQVLQRTLDEFWASRSR